MNNSSVNVSTGDIICSGVSKYKCVYRVLDRKTDGCWNLGSVDNKPGSWEMRDCDLTDGTITQARVLSAEVAQKMTMGSIVAWASWI